MRAQYVLSCHQTISTMDFIMDPDTHPQRLTVNINLNPDPARADLEIYNTPSISLSLVLNERGKY